MKLALAQLQISPDKEENLQKALDCIRKAAFLGAELIFFPEVQLTPFFPQYEKRDVSACVVRLDDEAVQAVCRVCREEKIFASPNFYIEENGRRYDMSLLIDDTGAIIGKQKMVHIAQCEQFYEQDYYTPSEEGFVVFDTRLGKLGIVVCFDRHYPESIRTEALMGADLILIPTANTTGEPSELFQWEIKIQAFQNSVNVAMCNRVGREDAMEFSGESIVADFNGNTLALAGAGEELLLCDVDLPGAKATRARKPYTDLRRTDLYL
ncbi:MAG: carbon-nitrogen hydrolase family protein [Oscillospiraceae bacterium]|nr:carbon-nitrogen hydrolase family protein [Oscillospiraceae bacterium]